MRIFISAVVALAVQMPLVHAQGGGPPPNPLPTGACGSVVTTLGSFGFLNNTSITGNELNIRPANPSVVDIFGNDVPLDGTNNSLATPNSQDNTASFSPGDAITISLSNTAGAAGQLVGIYYTPPPSFGITLSGPYAGTGTLFLNTATGFGVVVDGIGLVTGVPNIFMSHPGPGTDFSLTLALAPFPGINNTCTMVQAAVQDPTTMSGLRMSNAVALELRTSVRGFSPNFGPAGTTTTVTSPGVTSGTLTMNAIPVAGSSDTITVSSNNLSFVVPPRAFPGPVMLTPANAPNAGSVTNSDTMSDTFIATFATPQVLTSPATLLPLTFTALAGVPQTLGVAVINTLQSPTSTDSYTFTVNAGDPIVVTASAMTNANNPNNGVIDGFGRLYNPAAADGCDLRIELYETNNGNPLTFDQGAMGPFLVAVDDNSGPGRNAGLAFIARTTDTYQLRVFCANPSAFAGGRYLLNVGTLTGIFPSVESFRIGATTVNTAAPAQVVSIIGHNFPTTGTVDVMLNPVHGRYGTVVVAGVTPVSSTRVDFTVPAFAVNPSQQAGPPTFLVGDHEIRVKNNVTGFKSKVWHSVPSPGSNVVPGGGIAPDRLFMRSPSVIAPVNGVATIATSNTQTYALQTSGASPSGATFTFSVSPGQTVYAEALGVKYDLVNPFSLVDSGFETGNGTAGVFDPALTLYDAAQNIVAYNDDGGVAPTPFPWQNNGGTPGIGRNAAVLFAQPFGSQGAQTFTLHMNSPNQVGPNAQSRGYMVNIVVY